MQIRRRYKWVNKFAVRKGDHTYWYTKLRMPGRPSIDLPDIHAPEFEAAYQAALRGETPVVPANAPGCGPGTVNDLVAKYLASNPFKSENTAARRKSTLKQFCAAKGRLPLAKMTQDFLQRSLKAMNPHPAKTFLLAIRPVLEFAKAEGMIEQNPADGLNVEVESKHHHTWTAEQIAQHRAQHALGTMARAALELLLCQGLRRSDAIRVGPQHVRRIGGHSVISISSQKTDTPTYNPIELELLQALEACPVSGHSTFLVRSDGRPFDERSFNKAFAGWVKIAGLPTKCVPHGLRRSFAAQRAESGCSASELQAAGGWKTWKEPQHYTADANRLTLALSAAAKQRAARSNSKSEATL
jgi:integrase